MAWAGEGVDVNDRVKLAGYSFLNLRLASSLIPYTGVAWMFGFPEWMAWAGAAMLVFALGGEAFTAYAHGMAALAQEKVDAMMERQAFDGMASAAERWANGEGWMHHGSEEATPEEEDDEGGTTVSAG